MKIGLPEITKMIQDSKAVGYDITMKDISYVVMMESFEDKEVVYTILFGKESGETVTDYESTKKMKFLKKYIKTNFVKTKKDSDAKSSLTDMSFEENKEQLIKNLQTIKEMRDKGELDAKDFIKLDIEIRTKLNDKFAVSEKQDDQRVIVYKKYNDICVCGREIYRPTRDDIIEDLQKEYDLVPKKKTEEEV